MANEQNLLKGEDAHKFTLDEASKGGKASAEARRKKRDLRAALEVLLEREVSDGNGGTITGAQALTARLYKEALKGNVKAFEVLRDTVGQKPVEKVVVADVDPNVIDEVEKAVFESD